MIKNLPNLSKILSIHLLLTFLFINTSCKIGKNNNSKWETIFNGTNLNGWTVESIDKKVNKK